MAGEQWLSAAVIPHCVSTSGCAGVGATGAVAIFLMYCTWFYLW